ncbi:MAG: D-lyxose/D-mannose family sugar isomerase [Clostridia bacterium]|nr:D-lyxose/D-mannose family sugar isomerase [Clostridia bacterium]
MKRSEINQIMRDALEFAESNGFRLPPFVRWTPGDWLSKGHEYDEIRDCMLGWDITDFGSGAYFKTGLLMITLRNGSYRLAQYAKPYAEKLLISGEGQVTPCHFHWNKVEDIIVRGGGNLLVQVYNATDDDRLADTPVEVFVDGLRKTVEPGAVVRLTPGESITLPSRQYHSFRGEEGFGKVLVGEVSRVNDDRSDNRFLEPAGRFPQIQEDEKPLHLLYTEYPSAP